MVDDYTIVEITIIHAINGLYLTPDMNFFSRYLHHEELKESIQKIVHDKQPTASSYLAFADHVYDEYNDWIKKPGFVHQFLNVLQGLNSSLSQIDLCVDSMVAMVTSIYLKSLGIEDYGIYPRVIPKELSDIVITPDWHINSDIFYTILNTEPWLNYSKRLREQYTRTIDFFKQHENICAKLKDYYDFYNTIDLDVRNYKPSEYLMANKRMRAEETKRALKRAVKLFERMGLTHELRVFLMGLPLWFKGQQYDYTVLRDNEGLFNRTLKRNTQVAPMTMRILDKKSGVLLGSCCLYFDDTSILDHLFNLKFYIQNKETELEMLQAAHITSATTKFYNDSLLPDLKGLYSPLNAPPSLIHNIMLHNDHKVQLEVFKSLHFMKPMAKRVLLEVSGLPKSYMSLIERAELENFHMFDFIDNEQNAYKFVEEMATLAQG